MEEPDHSLSHSMDSAKKHYSSLFLLPSYKHSLFYGALICLIGVSLAAYSTTLTQILNVSVLGITVFVISILSDALVSKVVLKNDPIFNARRTSGMTFYCWLIWIGFIGLGVLLTYIFGSWLLWVKLTLLGFGAVSTLRILVLSATSNGSNWRQITSALLQPILCIVMFSLFWLNHSATINQQVLIFIVFAPIIGYAAVYLLLHTIDRLGQDTYGLPSMPLFKAFLLNWVTDANAPLETYLEEMGENADIEVSLLKFDASKPKAAVIVPLVHPGPFKNIGSSLLPSLLKHAYESHYGCSACTPLGILGHELDLASQAQNQKIVAKVISSAIFDANSDIASPFVKIIEGTATASCQIFGDTLFLAFSLAPKTTEDLPQELRRMVSEEAKRYGFEHVIVVNAHNCLGAVDDTNEHVDELKRAAFKCMLKAIGKPKKAFSVGSASVFPSDFTLKQGMGTGGITAIVVEVEGQKTVYIVIDGNNMVPFLREKILEFISLLGFDDCEVFTTDTHAVSALVTSTRGYCPIGEAISHDALMVYIEKAAKKAASNLEAAKAGCIQFTVPSVIVIGEERLKSITLLIDKAIQKAKHIIVPIFGMEGIILISLLLLI